jgi:type I restriction enzyme S subunit
MTGWKVAKLSTLLEIQNGYAFDAKLFDPVVGTPLIRIRDLKAGAGTETYFNGPYDKKYIVNSGDLLIGMDGDFGCYEWKGNQALLNQRVCRLQNFADTLHPKFLLYGINSILKEIEKNTGYVTVKHLSSKTIQSIEFPLPPLAIQKAIVAKLDAAFVSIDTAIAAAEKNAENAKQLFQSYLSDVFEKGGEGWEETKLVDICTINPSKKEVKSLPADTLVSFMPMEDLGIATQNAVPIHEKPIGDLIKSYTYFRENEVLLAKITPCFENGKLGIAKKLANGIGFGSSEYIVFRPNAELLSDYLYYFFERNEFRILGASHMSGAVGHKRVSKEFIENSKIILPPIQVQKSIVGKLNTIFHETKMLIETYRKRTIALRSLKQSLLQQAFSGQLVDA